MNAHYLQEFRLWEGTAPLTVPEDAAKKEHFRPNEPDGIERLTEVTVPTITFYPCSWKGDAEKERIRPAVLVCPGGGYSILAWNHEGRDVCAWLNLLGFSAFLLKYRCPSSDHREQPRADASRALRFIRAKAADFEIDPARLGCIGFSAGANLCAAISAPPDDMPYPVSDEIDQFSCRPDYTALIYPWEITEADCSVRSGFHVDAKTPPTFLAQAEDDFADPKSSLGWYMALLKSGVKAELHLWPSGGHGYGLLKTGNPTDDWGELAGRWFLRQGGLKN